MDLGRNGRFEPGTFSPTALTRIVNKWQRFMLVNSGWNALFMDNHGTGRAVGRYASDSPDLRTISAKMIANHLAFQSGTVFLYPGQELAMANVPREWGMDKYRDIACVNHWDMVLRNYPDDLQTQIVYCERYRSVGRDNTRTPMQWNGQDLTAGFMPDGAQKTEPWKSIHPDYPTWNVANAVADQKSSFHHWRRVLKMRKQYLDIFVYGCFEMLNLDVDDEVIAYIRAINPAPGLDRGRSVEPSQALVVASFSADEIWWTIPRKALCFLLDLSNGIGMTVLNTHSIVSKLGNYEGWNELRLEEGSVALRRALAQSLPFSLLFVCLVFIDRAALESRNEQVSHIVPINRLPLELIRGHSPRRERCGDGIHNRHNRQSPESGASVIFVRYDARDNHKPTNRNGFPALKQAKAWFLRLEGFS